MNMVYLNFTNINFFLILSPVLQGITSIFVILVIVVIISMYYRLYRNESRQILHTQGEGQQQDHLLHRVLRKLAIQSAYNRNTSANHRKDIYRHKHPCLDREETLYVYRNRNLLYRNGYIVVGCRICEVVFGSRRVVRASPHLIWCMSESFPLD